MGRTDIDTANPIVLVVLRAFIAMAAAAVGGVIGMSKKTISHKTLCSLVSVAAGALLAVTTVNIIPETVELLGGVRATAGILVGTLVFAGIGKYVYFMCPACAASATAHESGYLRLGLLLMIAMGIHSTVDGLAITAGTKTASMAGLLILFAVSYHKIPEGLALVSVARLAGYSRAKALGVTLLIELTTAIGALAGVLLLRGMDKFWLGITLAAVAGSFTYTVGFAVLREMYAHEKQSIILYALIGFASILGIGYLLAGIGIHHVH